MAARLPRQQSLKLPTWGGARAGAGRKPAGAVGGSGHRSREPIRPYQPVHVTLRVRDDVWNLRSRRSFAAFEASLRGVAARPDFRVVHFSVQGNHLHLIVEANGTAALANGMRALGIRLARALNAMMERKGPVFADRYHAHVLRTCSEVRNALPYVLGNHASHAARRGEPLPASFVDRYSSRAPRRDGSAQTSLWPEQMTSAATSWVLRSEQGALGGAWPVSS